MRHSMLFNIIHSDCLAALREMPEESVDSIVTDPPYGFGFMGKHWDAETPSVDVFSECLRLLRPGGHLLAFGGPRTYHRLAVAVEDAGFEIRDQMMWLYGTGFPKSHNVSKAIDKMHGAERVAIIETAPATEDAQEWDGWGTALKPAHEPIVMARKPFKGTVAANVLEHGTGAINIDGCRVGEDGGTRKASVPTGEGNGIFGQGLHGACDIEQLGKGRFPANIMHDGSDAVLGIFPMTSEGSAARYFYCAKASKRDRGEGNSHPTVKPTELMRYLVRLVTPPNGTVLDPFCGSGSTGKAAVLEGFKFIGIEREAEYVEIARMRCANATANTGKQLEI